MSSGPSRTGVGSLLGVLTLMALLRAVALALPTMHLWGLNAARFLPPWLRWTPLVISVATLHPAIGRLCLPGFEWLSRGRSLVLSILAVTLGLLIGFPDRVWFVGDYLLRMGIVSEAHGFETMFPQALPLDAIRHFWLPRTLGAWLHVAPTTIERALGVIEGAWLAVLACRFAKPLGEAAECGCDQLVDRFAEEAGPPAGLGDNDPQKLALGVELGEEVAGRHRQLRPQIA